MQSVFEGIWVPVVTPFMASRNPSESDVRAGEIDHAALSRLAKYLASQGVNGIVAGATTGEGALLERHEMERVYATLRQAAPGLPLILGLTELGTAAARRRATELASLKPDGLLVTPPCYLRPGQEGIQAYFEAVVEAADRPILVYNIPYRTGVSVNLKTLQALSGDPRIVGIKECGGSPERMADLVHETRLQVFAGDDHQNFLAMCLGAHGAIAATAHVFPAMHVRLRNLILKGDIAGARAIARAFQPLTQALFSAPNPGPLKALLNQQSWCEDSLREPFTPVEARLKADLLQALARLEAALPGL